MQIDVEVTSYDNVSNHKDTYAEDQNIVLFDIEDYEIFKKSLENLRFKINATIILGFSFKDDDKSKKNLLLIESLVKFDPLIKGIVDFSKSGIINFPIFRLINNKFSSVSKDELMDVSENLNSLMEFSSKELERIKLIHEKLVPIRVDSLAGINMTSKFGAGNSAGGDYFDIKTSGTKMLVFLVKTKSYIASNIVMSCFEEFSSQSMFELEDIQDLLKTIYLEISSKKIQADRKEIEVLVGRVGSKNLVFEGYNFGGNTIIGEDSIYVTSNELKLADDTLAAAHFEFKMERGEKLMAISSGVRDNCDGKIEGLGYIEYLQNRVNSKSIDTLNDVFYQLKKNQTGLFLDHDTTLIHLEVSKNVIIEI